MNMGKIRDQRTLQEAIRGGFRPEYLFFWGHKPLPSGEIGKPCLSQWWPASFTVEEQHYLTAEHYMMAEKARLFGDEEKRRKILEVASPAEAKQLGRAVRGFNEDVWARSRSEFVVGGNLAKFGQNPKLGEFLLNTEDRVLVEASPVDRIWGIGLNAGDKRAENPEQWLGLNLLGFALMEVRDLLQGSNHSSGNV
jgi:ribA/ribD-fused uncharacterized protein